MKGNCPPRKWHRKVTKQDSLHYLRATFHTEMTKQIVKETIFEVIVTDETFQFKLQEGHWFPSRIDTKKFTYRHIPVKLRTLLGGEGHCSPVAENTRGV